MAKVKPNVKFEERGEFVGQIIDLFEDFLEARGLNISNPEKAEDPESAAIIYGSDYGELQTGLESIMENWGVVADENTSNKPCVEIPLPSGDSLVVENYEGSTFPYEVYVGIQSKDGCWVQDLAIIRNSYSFPANNELVPEYKDGVFDVLVFADEESEDYTDAFHIKRAPEEEF